MGGRDGAVRCPSPAVSYLRTYFRVGQQVVTSAVGPRSQHASLTRMSEAVEASPASIADMPQENPPPSSVTSLHRVPLSLLGTASSNPRSKTCRADVPGLEQPVLTSSTPSNAHCETRPTQHSEPEVDGTVANLAEGHAEVCWWGHG